jgi:hypothetical protein
LGTSILGGQILIATRSLSLKTYVPDVSYVVEGFFDRLVRGEE